MDMPPPVRGVANTAAFSTGGGCARKTPSMHLASSLPLTAPVLLPCSSRLCGALSGLVAQPRGAERLVCWWRLRG